MAKNAALAAYKEGARTRTKSHSRAKPTIPLALVGGFIPLGIRAYNGFQGNGIVGLGDGITSGLTGYSVFSKKFEVAALMQGLVPILGGMLVHKLAGSIGINRALASARVPLLRI